MNEETKSKINGVAHDMAAEVQAAAEKNAKAATGWKRVAWILAAIGAAVVGYFTSGTSQEQPSSVDTYAVPGPETTPPAAPAEVICDGEGVRD